MAGLQPLKFITIAAKRKHTATVIFVHGLGDSGYGWAPVAQMYGSDPKLQHVKWVLPHAPEMSVSFNYGMTMPSWFDIAENFDMDRQDEPGMLKTATQLNQLITNEVDNGILPERIILGGFSQGAAMSLLTGLTTERKLGGIVVLSGWLPLSKKFKAMASDHVRSLPIFWGHGQSDPLVKYQWATDSVEFLTNELKVKRIGLPEPDTKTAGLAFHSYPGLQHSAGDQELEDLQSWLRKVVPPQEDS
ncbi:Phospholipase/carboxylesterase [Abortiporus biennis]|nr:Phospholipase/carboxylesterase [Abortiporus biennis]